MVDLFDEWQTTGAENVAVPTNTCWGEPPAPVSGCGAVAADRTTPALPIAG
ncbi:hypothetical protein [Umezawaea beigongshangensis]|uniref:hypothetical protein n=1 Tax=Umezawaea beigongshangensis TaxID=2780383 RepID=UPI001E2B4C4E|nr:hypothetical protein [Umezawaea beigongshangensis]